MMEDEQISQQINRQTNKQYETKRTVRRAHIWTKHVRMLHSRVLDSKIPVELYINFFKELFIFRSSILKKTQPSLNMW